MMKEAFEELQKRLFTGKPRDCYLAGKLAFAERLYNKDFIQSKTIKGFTKDYSIYDQMMQEIQNLINEVANEVYNNVKPSINFTGAKGK